MSKFDQEIPITYAQYTLRLLTRNSPDSIAAEKMLVDAGMSFVRKWNSPDSLKAGRIFPTLEIRNRGHEATQIQGLKGIMEFLSHYKMKSDEEFSTESTLNNEPAKTKFL